MKLDLKIDKAHLELLSYGYMSVDYTNNTKMYYLPFIVKEKIKEETINVYFIEDKISDKDVLKFQSDMNWINIQYNKPKESGRYWGVYLKKEKGKEFMLQGNFYYSYNVWCDEFGNEIKVTHWRRLLPNPI